MNNKKKICTWYAIITFPHWYSLTFLSATEDIKKVSNLISIADSSFTDSVVSLYEPPNQMKKKTYMHFHFLSCFFLLFAILLIVVASIYGLNVWLSVTGAEVFNVITEYIIPDISSQYTKHTYQRKISRSVIIGKNL